MQAIDFIWQAAHLKLLEPLPDEPAPELIPRVTATHWVEPYSVKHGAHWYYRYCWMSGRTIHHRHIPGGNIGSGAAQERAACVRSLINSGQGTGAIEQQIQVWRIYGRAANLRRG